MNSVLITGGTGYFGQAFAARLLNHAAVQRVCIYSRSEHAQAVMAAKPEFAKHASRLRFFIGDVRDRDRLRRAMQGCDVVVHAAALKRIEVGQYNPTEMFTTNTTGAINVVEAARDAKVRKVVALSTDKAWQPISPYGFSKAMAEAIFLSADDGHGTRFVVTRYGNVVGSTGSVIPKWRAMKAAGNKTVLVTCPDCTRFWMTIDEAVSLVWGAIMDDSGKSMFIPDLPAFRLGDLAMAMGLTIRIVGLPAHEKLHEGMGVSQSSEFARRLSVEQIKNKLLEIPE